VHDEFMRDILPFATGNVHPASWAGCMAAATCRACWRRCLPPG
jgi:hypothetical protein